MQKAKKERHPSLFSSYIRILFSTIDTKLRTPFFRFCREYSKQGRKFSNGPGDKSFCLSFSSIPKASAFSSYALQYL